jgi:hypothetical protein
MQRYSKERKMMGIKHIIVTKTDFKEGVSAGAIFIAQGQCKCRKISLGLFDKK